MTGIDIDHIINSPERMRNRLEVARIGCEKVVSETLASFLLKVTKTDGRQPNLPEDLMDTIFRECLKLEDQRHPWVMNTEIGPSPTEQKPESHTPLSSWPKVPKIPTMKRIRPPAPQRKETRWVDIRDFGEKAECTYHKAFNQLQGCCKEAAGLTDTLGEYAMAWPTVDSTHKTFSEITSFVVRHHETFYRSKILVIS